jgi:hypothetical protein
MKNAQTQHGILQGPLNGAAVRNTMAFHQNAVALGHYVIWGDAMITLLRAQQWLNVPCHRFLRVLMAAVTDHAITIPPPHWYAQWNGDFLGRSVLYHPCSGHVTIPEILYTSVMSIGPAVYSAWDVANQDFRRRANWVKIDPRRPREVLHRHVRIECAMF